MIMYITKDNKRCYHIREKLFYRNIIKLTWFNGLEDDFAGDIGLYENDYILC